MAKAVYTPKSFFLHAASLDQAFAHCRIFSTAATRRCMDRVSVPSLRATLSRPLPVVALVGRYPANKLIGPRPLSKRLATLLLRDHRELANLSTRCARPWGLYQGVTNSFRTIYNPCGSYTVRLACLIHAASVHPEPESNSLKRIKLVKYIKLGKISRRGPHNIEGSLSVVMLWV